MSGLCVGIKVSKFSGWESASIVLSSRETGKLGASETLEFSSILLMSTAIGGTLYHLSG